jgi:DNA processing protein
MLSLDSRVLLLLCSHLGLERDTDLSPLTLREWNALAHKIQSSQFNRPEGLLGRSVIEIKSQLALPEAESERLCKLLARDEDIDDEIRRLGSLGIHIITRGGVDYPQRYNQRLNDSAPIVLFYAGEPDLLGQPGIAVVGSRHLDQAGQECAAFVGNACGLSGLVLYSGGARGVDTISMNAALEARGSAAGILTDSLEKAIRPSEINKALRRGDLCLATPYLPSARFTVGAAMGRNRLIYCLADYAIVVASDAEKGGTWAGATEALKAGWIPVFVLDHKTMPEGNRLLLQKGGISFPHPFPEHYNRLPGWLHENGGSPKLKVKQLGLF